MRVLARECLHGADVLSVDEQGLRLQKYSPNVKTLVRVECKRRVESVTVAVDLRSIHALTSSCHFMHLDIQPPASNRVPLVV
jgi:hypothetical protein